MADLALTLHRYGHMGNSILDPYGFLALPEANRYTYSQLPVYLLSLSQWLNFVPQTVEWMRFFSVIWAYVYVGCWYFILRSLSRSKPLALLVASAVALDYAFIHAASNARIDMMCCALGQAGLASYICLRHSARVWGIFLAACFGTMSLFCHPLGLVTNASILVIVALEWRFVPWKGLPVFVLPYLTGGLLYLRYIMQAPSIFLAQSRSASSFRMSGLEGTLLNVLNDFYIRYCGLYYWQMQGVNKLKVFSLLFAIIGTFCFIAQQRLRNQPLGRVLTVSACVGYVGVAAIDNQKFPVYLIYSMPAMMACGTAWLYEEWQQRRPGRFIAAALFAASILTTITGFGYKTYRNDYARIYTPAVAAIERCLPRGGLVMGGSELGFALGFNSNLVDDRYLGYFSGRTPDVFVENNYYVAGPGPVFQHAWQVSRTKLHNLYRLTFANEDFRVYVLDSRVSGEAGN